MPNKAPIAVLTAQPTELTWPSNKAMLDLTQSYDPNRRGKIKLYNFKQVSPDTPKALIDDSQIQKASVVFPKPLKTTVYSFEGTVTDRGGLTGSSTINIKLNVPIVKTSFGISGPDIGNNSNLLKEICGFPSCTRHQVILVDYKSGSPDKGVEQFIKLGVPVFLNFNEKHVEKDNQGNKIPNPFPTDLVVYEKMLRPPMKWFADNYKDLLGLIVATCENEPTTDAFHSGPMSDYLKMLEVFVKVCKDLGYTKYTDGAVHVGTVLGADSPDGEGKAKDVRELLLGYKNIDLWRVAMHSSNTSANYNAASTPEACGIVMDITGHQCVSNEWHVQSKQGYTGTTDTLKSMMQGWVDAAAQGYGLEYSVYISGTSPDDESLVKNGILTDFGKGYQAFINKYRTL